MWACGITSFFMGELTITRERFEQTLALDHPENSAATDQIIQVFADLNTSQSKTKILAALYKHSVSGVDREDEQCIR